MFVRVDVEPGPASEDGASMRFKRARADDERVVRELAKTTEL